MIIVPYSNAKAVAAAEAEDPFVHAGVARIKAGFGLESLRYWYNAGIYHSILTSVNGGTPSGNWLKFFIHDAGGADSQVLVMNLIGDGSVQLGGNLVMGASKTVDGVDISAHNVDSSAHHIKTIPGITFNLGLATVGTKQAQALIPSTFIISLVKIYSDVAPTGASLIVDVNKNGVTIFTTQANRPAIPIDGHSDDSGTPDITTLTAGDRLSVDVDQVGSTIAGGDDLVVVVVGA